MKYSYKWLQQHLEKPLPKADELARVITAKAFEVEEIEEHDWDTVFDIKVLPDRAHDALSHRGMAREIAALFDLPRKEIIPTPIVSSEAVSRVSVTIEDPARCPRYIGVRVDNVAVAPSPEEYTTKLSSIGQRSINNIVDLTNIILFDMGQPMHAFDAKKVEGGITVRLAKPGEAMTTLDGKALTFDGTELVIADDGGVLALAGVKGGKKAEVDEHTTSIIVECANFDPTETRKTSTKHGIKTDASKRFENGMTSELAGEAIKHALFLLSQVIPSARIGTTTDVYSNPEKEKQTIVITLREINQLLGSTMTASDMSEIFHRLCFEYKKDEAESELDLRYVVTSPFERLDLRIKEDLIDEIGRHYGYEKIPSTLPKLTKKGVPNKRLYYANKVRNFLIERGFSEVYTYSFAKKGEGDVEVINAVGKDRPFMRSTLHFGISESLKQNAYYAPLIQIEDVRIFEIGNVWSGMLEHTSLTVALQALSKNQWKNVRGLSKQIMEETLAHLGVSGLQIVHKENGPSFADISEINFDEATKDLPEPTENEPVLLPKKDITYKTLSTYPFIVRDVALWVPEETTPDLVEAIIRAYAGPLAQKIYLFDTFVKKEEHKKSLAFRMVLQSFEKTLADADANEVYDRVVKALQKANPAWQVRI